MKKEKIAVVGSGISGLTAAYFLSEKYDVKLYEKNDYFGGHSNTVTVDYNGKRIPVDTGFIVFNKKTYPNLIKFFELLNVTYKESNMSFSVKINNGELEYAGTNLASVFAQKKNILNPSYLRMLYDIFRFNKGAENILENEFDPSYSLGNFLDDLKFGRYFKEYYLLPMSAAIWSCPLNTMLSYPAQSFIRFFKNHGLLTVSDQPQWYTVDGGSKEYVKIITDKIENKTLVDPVFEIKKISDGKLLIKSKKSEEIFDKVVIAAHSNQSLQMIENPSNEQFEVISKFRYQANIAILHKDSSIMPNSEKAWASWVYSKNSNDKKDQLSVSYWMNNLQKIDGKYPLFVTLNPNQKIKNSDIFAQFKYEHPIFDEDAIKAQEKVSDIQGIDNIYFCGAYQKYGFHEDGLSSALQVVNLLGVKAPWQ